MMSEDRNQSAVVVFILLGFSDYPDLQTPLFFLFLIIYMVTVMGNLGMIIIIRINTKLHTPMYFFLSHLSFVDFCYSTGVTPKLLEILVVEDRRISFACCISQYFFTATSVLIEACLLAVMAYDRYVAIRDPLLYMVIISQKRCMLLVTGSYVWGITSSFIFTYSLIRLSFCGTNIINNFLCEYSVLLSASCSDKHISEMILFILANFNVFSTLITVLMSYILIFFTIINMQTATGRIKAFSTCASHLTAICIFYGSLLFLYCVPSSKNSWLIVKVTTVFYTVVIPMLNPLIYSLRNKDVKETVKKLMGTNIVSF